MPSNTILFRLIRAAFLGSVIIKNTPAEKQKVVTKLKKTSRDDILNISIK